MDKKIYMYQGKIYKIIYISILIKKMQLRKTTTKIITLDVTFQT